MKRPRYITVLFGPIGDALMTAALFDDILELEPDARFLVLTRNGLPLIRDIMRAYPSVEIREIPSGLRALPFFASLYAKRSTFLALGVAGKYSSRLKLFFRLLSWRPGNRTLGFNDRESGKKSHLALQQVFFFDAKILTIDNFRRLLPPLFGDAVQKLQGKAPRATLELDRPPKWSLEDGRYIVIHFFGSRVIRRLPPRRMKYILEELQRRYPNYALVLTGSKDDSAAVDEIKSAAPHAKLFIGQPLLQVGWVIEHAALYIGVDTGITHLAGVLQQKSLIISHCADPMWMPLYNPNARVLLNSTRCECWTTGNCIVVEDGVQYRRCLYDISDKLILDSIALALSSSGRDVPAFAGLIDEKNLS